MDRSDMDGYQGAFLGVTMPPWQVYTLGGLLIAIGLAIPWVAWWQGWFQSSAPSEVRAPQPLRPALVMLPGGWFYMDGPDATPVPDDGRGPERWVQVSAFEMCQTEVTQASWHAVMGSRTGACKAGGCGAKRPAHAVTWLDAVTYLNELTTMENLRFGGSMSRCYERERDVVTRVPGCTGYRLPTEAEWEYAARAGIAGYSVGDDASMLGQYAWFRGNAGGAVHPVAEKRPNAWGLYDMHGNAWEWVWDRYDPAREHRVVRGGGVDAAAQRLRTGARQAQNIAGGAGFRCARSPGG